MKHVRKERIGSQLKRNYGAPQTPLDRLRACKGVDKAHLARLLKLRDATDPFALARTIETKLDRIAELAPRRTNRITKQMA